MYEGSRRGVQYGRDVDTFRASADVRVADHVDPLDAFHGVTRALEDASRATGDLLRVSRVYVKAEDGSTTLARDTLQAAVDELATMGLGFNYAFQSLGGAPRDSVTVFVWKDVQRVQVSLGGPDRVRVEGFRFAAQRYLDSLAAVELPPVAVEVVAPQARVTGGRRRPWWRRPVVWVATALGTIVVGVATAGIVYLLGWN